MPKPTLANIMAAIPDPMLSDNFELQIPNPPAGVGNGLPFTMQCRTAQKPGVTINPVDIQLFGHQVEHAGNLTYTHDLTVEFVENRMADITTRLEAWADMIRSHESQHGAFKSEYARDANFIIYDQKGNIVKQYVLVNCWPSQVPELPFDGQAANAISLSVTFKYDYYYERV